MRIAHCTDIHLDHLPSTYIDIFLQNLKDAQLDGIYLTGDISNSRWLYDHLHLLSCTSRKLFYVLGNHDYYGSSLCKVRTALPKSFPNYTYMSSSDPLFLTEDTMVVGVDGWGDAYYGNPFSNKVFLNDWNLIEDFQEYFTMNAIVSFLRELGAQEADNLENHLSKVPLDLCNNLHILTHVPPWREASLYQGKLSDPEFVPFFTCKSVGDVIEEFSNNNPSINITVFGGHSHDKFDGQITDRIRCVIGAACYGRVPTFKIFDF